MRKLRPHRKRFLLEYLEPRVLLSDTPIAVTQFSVDASGFTAQFNQAVDATVLNLYDTEAGILGPADVTVEGAIQGPIRGSLIVKDNQLTFVKSGGVLAPDVYTVTMRSAATGIKGADGSLLDGNSDGTSDDNYVHQFAVNIVPPTLIHVEDFARGPAQEINPGSGLPVTLLSVLDVTDIRFSLNFDPALLKITEVRIGSGLPVGTQLQSDLTQSGTVSINISSTVPIGPGTVELIRLIAEVPASAVYARSGVLDLSMVSVNDGLIPTIGDDGVQVVANLGDATGNERYSALDGAKTLRVVAGLDSGFAPYPTIDPAIVADITGNNSLSSLDGTRILQEVVGLDRPEIPDIVPVILVGLVEDTGISDSDLITSNPAVTGSVSDDGGVLRFRAGLDDMLPENYVDVTADLQGSTFTFTRERLEQILGAPLSDGPHTLHLQAIDSDGIGPIPGGSTAPAPVPGPGAPGPVFDPGAPTPIFNPGSTVPVFGPGAPSPVINPGAPSPTFDESNSPNTSIVDLSFTLESEIAMTMAFGFSAGLDMEASGDGMTGSALFFDANTVTMPAIDVSGNSTPSSGTMSAQSDFRADFSLQPEQQPLELSLAGNSEPVLMPQVLDMVSLAQYDTLTADYRQTGQQGYQIASRSKLMDGAVVRAVSSVRDVVFPSKKAVFEKTSKPLRDTSADEATAEAAAETPDEAPTTSKPSTGEKADDPSLKPRKEPAKLKTLLLSFKFHKRRLR